MYMIAPIFMAEIISAFFSPPNAGTGDATAANRRSSKGMLMDSLKVFMAWALQPRSSLSGEGGVLAASREYDSQG
jgi:hypothetical protein